MAFFSIIVGMCPFAVQTPIVFVVMIAVSPIVGSIFNTELVVNGGAENGVVGWTMLKGNPVDQPYSGNTAPNPNPPVCQTHLFLGGTPSGAKMSQVVDIGSASTSELLSIDMGIVTVTYSAYVGGWDDQADYANVTFQPQNSSGNAVDTITSCWTSVEQRNSVSVLLLRTVSTPLAANTRRFLIVYECQISVGAQCDGYADAISIKLTAPNCSCGTVCPSGALCPAGFYCAASSGFHEGVACISGDYCSAGSCFAADCPAGSVCSTPSMRATCAIGSYCPARTTIEGDCPAGSVCSTTSMKATCANGSYCPARTTVEGDCPAGSVCSTPSTKITCPAGSYCPRRCIAPVKCASYFYCTREGMAAPSFTLSNSATRFGSYSPSTTLSFSTVVSTSVTLSDFRSDSAPSASFTLTNNSQLRVSFSATASATKTFSTSIQSSKSLSPTLSALMSSSVSSTATPQLPSLQEFTSIQEMTFVFATVTFVTQVVGGSVISASVGSSAVRAAQFTALQQHLSRCQDTTTDDLDYFSNPLQLRFGSERGAAYRGAVVGNILVMATATGLVYLLVLIATPFSAARRKHPHNLWEAFAVVCNLVHLPGRLMAMFAFLSQPLLMCSIVLLAISGLFDIALGMIGTVVALALPTGLCFFVITIRFRAVGVAASSQPLSSNPLMRLLTTPRTVWSDAGGSFCSRYEVVFGGYRHGREWFFNIENVSGLAAGLIGGGLVLINGSSVFCGALKATLGGVCALVLIVTIILRPYNRVADSIPSIGLNSMTVLWAVVAVAIDGDLSDRIALAQSIASTVLVATDFIIKLSRRQCIWRVDTMITSPVVTWNHESVESTKAHDETDPCHTFSLRQEHKPVAYRRVTMDRTHQSPVLQQLVARICQQQLSALM